MQDGYAQFLSPLRWGQSGRACLPCLPCLPAGVFPSPSFPLLPFPPPRPSSPSAATTSRCGGWIALSTPRQSSNSTCRLGGGGLAMSPMVPGTSTRTTLYSLIGSFLFSKMDQFSNSINLNFLIIPILQTFYFFFAFSWHLVAGSNYTPHGITLFNPSPPFFIVADFLQSAPFGGAMPLFSSSRHPCFPSLAERGLLGSRWPGNGGSHSAVASH